MREERDAAVDEPERSRDGRIPLFGVGKTNDFAFAEVVAAAVTPELREFSVVIFDGAGAFDDVVWRATRRFRRFRRGRRLRDGSPNRG